MVYKDYNDGDKDGDKDERECEPIPNAWRTIKKRLIKESERPSNNLQA